MGIEGVIALLHLSAVVSVLAIAYLGFDHHEIPPDHRDAELKASRKVAHDVMYQLGLTEGILISKLNRDRWTLRTLFPAGVICIVAEKPLDLGEGLNRMHMCYRQVHIPLFDYILKREDIPSITALAAVSLFMFFFVSASLIWHFEWVLTAFDGELAKIWFMLLVAICSFILVSGAAVRLLKQRRLVELCKKLHNVINRRFKKFRNTLELSLDFAERAAESARHAIAELDAAIEQPVTSPPISSPTPVPTQAPATSSTDEATKPETSPD